MGGLWQREITGLVHKLHFMSASVLRLVGKEGVFRWVFGPGSERENLAYSRGMGAMALMGRHKKRLG